MTSKQVDATCQPQVDSNRGKCQLPHLRYQTNMVSYVYSYRKLNSMQGDLHSWKLFFFFDNPDLKEETFKFKLKLHGNFQTMEISKRKPTGKENLFPGNISRFALRHLPIHETPLLLLNLWRRTLNKCSWKIWKTGATYGRRDCVECKDFRNVGDLFHSLRPAKATFNPIFDNSKN